MTDDNRAPSGWAVSHRRLRHAGVQRRRGVSAQRLSLVYGAGGQAADVGAARARRTFTAFVVVYVADRWLLVRRRNFPVVRAFFQVAFAVAFLALLWPQQAFEFRRSRDEAAGVSQTARLLVYGDPDVRAAACELAAYRGEAQHLETLEAMARGDPSPDVRDACDAAATRLRHAGAAAP